MLTFILLSLAQAATWTVDPSGGGDATTIADGVALLSEGDTLTIAPGTYDVQTVQVLPDDVTIEGAGWDRTIFDGSLGSPLSPTDMGLAIVGQGVTIRGIGFQGYAGDETYATAVLVAGSATFESCAFVENRLGILAWSYNVANIAVHNSIFAENDFAIYTEFDLDTLRVESSLFVDNGYGFLFEDNTNPGSGRFNLIASINNTFVGGTRAISIGGGYGTRDEADFQVYVVNNLILGSQFRWVLSLDEYPSPTVEVRNNVYSAATDVREDETVVATDNLEAEPELVAWSDDGDWTNDDLRLVAGSPGIDAGVAGYGTWPTDLDGLDRALDGDGDELALPDAGAYEYCPPELCPPPEPDDTGDADTGAPTDTGGSGDGGGDDTSPPPGTGGAGTVDRPSSTGLFGCSTAPGHAAGAGLALALAALLGRRRPRANSPGLQSDQTLSPR